MSKMFVTRTFSETAKSEVTEMIGKLREAFRQMIEEATWMSNSTKGEAFKKLAATKQKVGYPDTDFEEADIERLYENYTMSADNYYNNLLRIKEIALQNNLALLRKPVDKNKWDYPPYIPNAYASWQKNEIGILAGYLQLPYYSESNHDYLNYGGIGSVIGHELTHLFDDRGRRYDENGNLRNWWTKQDEANFFNRSKCIVDQFSNFYVDEINMTLSGVRTQGETIGDTGGLKEAFRAYKNVVLTHSNIQGQLPDLNLTQDQLFFLSFGQTWCHKITKEKLLEYANSAEHPPGKYRALGTLQNSEDFARAYNCPRGSYMNPEQKCEVW